MSLLAVLNLSPPARVLAPADASAGEGPSKGGESRRKPIRAKVGVTEGEVSLIGQSELGSVRWRGHDGKLWAMTDTGGNEVTGGPSLGWKQMAEANARGSQAVQAIAGLGNDETRWTQAYVLVRNAYQRGLTELKAFDAVEKAFAKREGEADFAGEMNAFLKARAVAMVLADKIGLAEQGFKLAALKVDALLTRGEVAQAEDVVAAKQQQVQAKEAEIAEAKAVFADLFDTVTKLVKEDWEGLATKAISSFADAFIETGFAAELAAAKAGLERAQGRLKGLRARELAQLLEAGRADMLTAAMNCDIAQKELVAGLDELGRLQRMAMGELEKKPDTALGAKMLQGQLDLRLAVSVARGWCQRYLAIAGRLVKEIGFIEAKFGYAGSWLDDAAKGGPQFARGGDWAKLVKSDADANVKTLKAWARHVANTQAECAKTLKWLDDDKGKTGPEAPFISAIERMNRALQPKAKMPAR